MDACPTKAIVEPERVDARKCISYLTIELKDEIPEEFRGKMKNRVFGCDICQEVCPFNKKAKPHHEPAFLPDKEWFGMSKQNWLELDEDKFERIFKKSALQRTKFRGLKRNLDFLK
jgi:epoxyqueuosine reductase